MSHVGSSGEILLGIRTLQVPKLKVVRLIDLDFKEKKIEDVRNAAADKSELQKDAFDLLFGGSVLEDGMTLETCGLKDKSMIHVLERKESPEKSENLTEMELTDVTVKSMTTMFESYIGNPLLEITFRKVIKKPEVIENIIASCPGMSEDPVAIAILQDPELIMHFTDPETIKRIGKLHPVLLKSANYIASAVLEEAHNYASTSGGGSSSANSSLMHPSNFTFDSDDEEMVGDSSQSSDSTGQYSNNNQRPTGAAAGGSGGPITIEMFYNAMQQALGSNPARSDPPTPAAGTGNPAPESGEPNLQTQINLMHEMGLMNDAINVQALQVTNGDVQEAIGLVLSGFGEN